MDEQKPGRTTSGAVLRAYLGWLERRGLRESLMPRLPPQTQMLVRQPPLATTMIDSRRTDDLLVALSEVHGPALVRELGRDAMKTVFLPLLRPLVDSTLAINGRTPAALFERLTLLAGPLIAGATMTWSPESEVSGTIEISYPGAPEPAVFSLWEGILEVLGEVCSATMAVEGLGLGDAGRTGRFRARWS